MWLFLRRQILENSKIRCLISKISRSLKRAKNRLILQEKEMKELRWEREVLEQRFSKLEAEKDKLHKNFVSAIQEVVQKSNFKKLFLERKGKIFNDFYELLFLYIIFRWNFISWLVVALADSLEKKDAQLNEILAASNLDPAALSGQCLKSISYKLSGKNLISFECIFWLHVLTYCSRYA